MPVYTEPSDLASLNPIALAAELRQLIHTGFAHLSKIDDAVASEPLSPGKWSTKQVVGHLIDSAVNNHQRFVRLQIEPELRLPGYRQNEWVAVQRYDLLPWAQVLDTWRVMNLHLAHVLQHVAPAHLGHVWHFEEGDLTLGFIAEDYIAHMAHHLKHLKADPLRG